MDMDSDSKNGEHEKKLKLKINNINKIILNILCTEAIRKIQFVLYILKELQKKKMNILHAYISTKIDHLSTDKSQKQAFYELQDKIELCENEYEYNKIKVEIDKYIESLKERNDILCQNSLEDRNLKENRNKIIQDGTVLLNIFKSLKQLDFNSVSNELRLFKDEQNLQLKLKESVFHKRQIINILKEQIKEQNDNITKKKKKIETNIEEIEKEKKIFFVKSMLYSIYKNEHVQANIFSYNINMNVKTNLQKQKREELEDTLMKYDSISNYIQSHLNKRNDHLQHIHDELVEYYEKEKIAKNEKIKKLEQEIAESIKNIELKKKQIQTYEEQTQHLENVVKNKLKKEIEEREFLKKYKESILFLQYVGRKKILEEQKKKKKLMMETKKTAKKK